MAYFKEFVLKTGVEGTYNITQQVIDSVRESGIEDGMAYIFCPHTTAAVTITENTDPDVTGDMLFGLKQSFPNIATLKAIPSLI